MGEIRGSQKREAREAAIQLLDPRTTPSGPVIVGGIPKSGGMGLNLVASHDAVYMSNDYNLMTRKQSEDRIHRSGQVRACSYFDIVATGPKGQKTVDHLILKALRDKDNLATWTTSAWVHALTEE
jgi:SNF2 family DNA or RNA helicase